MSKGNSSRNDNAFSVQHGLCGSYDFVLIPTSEGLFYGLLAGSWGGSGVIVWLGGKKALCGVFWFYVCFVKGYP